MAVVRVSHQENYVVISKLVLEDPNLSFKAKGLWAYCMSRPNDWVFHVSHLAKISKDKEDKIYSALKELESEGYVQRVQKNVGGRFGSVDYLISEVKIKNDTIKENLPLAGFPVAGFPDAGNPVLLSNDNTNSSPLRVEEEMIYKEGRQSPPPSADASALTDHFLSKIKERSPQFKTPKLEKWVKEMDCLLRIDKRNLEECKKLIDWAAHHKWWSVACLSISKLRKSYDEMLLQMNAEKNQFIIRENRTYALEMKSKYPEEMKGLSFDDKYVMNRTTGKEAPFSLPVEQFKHALASLFGARRVG